MSDGTTTILLWRGEGERRTVAYQNGPAFAEVVREHTDEGPRWFAKALPSKGIISGPHTKLREAAIELVRAVEEGEV